MSKQYWFISYCCRQRGKNDAFFAIDAIDKSPAEWAMEATLKYEDGPYCIVYAEKLSKTQYEDFRERL